MHAQRYGRTRCEAQSKPNKKIIHLGGEKTVSLLLSGVKMRYVARKNAPRLLSAVCHLSSYQQSEKQPFGLINMFKADHESEPLGPEFLSLSKPFPRRCAFLDACIRRTLEGRPQPSTKLLFLTQRSHSFNRHNKIDVLKE